MVACASVGKKVRFWRQALARWLAGFLSCGPRRVLKAKEQMRGAHSRSVRRGGGRGRLGSWRGQGCALPLPQLWAKDSPLPFLDSTCFVCVSRSPRQQGHSSPYLIFKREREWENEVVQIVEIICLQSCENSPWKLISSKEWKNPLRSCWFIYNTNENNSSDSDWMNGLIFIDYRC